MIVDEFYSFRCVKLKYKLVMDMLIYYIGFIVFLYLLIQTTPIYLNLYTAVYEKEIKFEIKVSALAGLLNFNFDFERLKYLSKNIVKITRRSKPGKNLVKNLEFPVYFFSEFINYVILHKLYLKFFIGLKDASKTALIMGVIYSIIGALKPKTDKVSLAKDYSEKIYIKPYYDQYKLELELDLKIKFRILHITMILIKQVKKLIKRRISKWIPIPSRV